MRQTHAARVERWLGADLAEAVARQAHGWPGPPIPVAGVPGRVYVTGAGEYIGPIRGGYYASLADYAVERYRKALRSQLRTAATGFASLSDLITEATTGGKSQQLHYQKNGLTTAAVGQSQHLWGVGTFPVAGGNAAGAPGGTVITRTTGGALGPQTNPGGTDTLHLTTWTGWASGISAVMLQDYLYGVNNSVNATNTAVTGVPTRYQSTNAAGNFITGRVTTVLSATATNITVTYQDQDGNAAEAAAAIAARVSAAVNTQPFTAPAWFVPLNSGDTGARKITNVQSSGANTGVVDWMICHALAILPCPVANQPFILDGINSAFNLVKIETDACLTLMEYVKPATAAMSYGGLINLVSG